MPDSPQPSETLVQTCPSCAALLDVSNEDPLAQVHCPLCGTAVQVERTYNHFAIRELLGRGGMGAVYRAEDLSLKRLVALKILRRDIGQEQEHRAQLEQEARITASINHPHVVKVYTFGEAHGQFYLAMELVDKGSLDDLMQVQNRVAEVQVLEVGLQIAQGLQAAAKVGLIHRDVKPGNILFANSHTAKIVDFGLAILMEKEAEARGEVWGTPYYIAPEKLNHEQEDFRSDIYSLGGTLFHAVAGRPPFEAATASLVALKHLKSQAVSLQAFAPDVSGEMAFVINRMLNKNPDERYQSYDELIEHLQFAYDAMQEKSRQPRGPKQRVVVESDWSKRVFGWMTLLTLLAVVVAVVVFGWMMFAKDGDKGGRNAGSAAQSFPLAATDFRETLVGESRDQYEEAMRLLSSGRFKDAQAVFVRLASNEEVGQPAQNWARLLGAISALFHGDRGVSVRLLSDLQKHAVFSNEPADLPLADFFARAAVLLTRSDFVLESEVSEFKQPDGKSLLLLLAGLGNWQGQHWDESGKILKAFVAIEPDGQLAWISDMHAPTQKLLDMHERIGTLEREADKLKSPAEVEEALTEVRGFSESLSSSDVLQTRLNVTKRIIEVRGRVFSDQADRQRALEEKAKRDAEQAKIDAEKARVETERVAGEEKRWNGVVTAVSADVPRYEFERLSRQLKVTEVESEKFQAEKEKLLARAEMLQAFLNTIGTGVSTAGYPKEIVSRRGTRYREGFNGFNKGAFQTKTPYGAIEVLVSDFAPETLLEIHANFAAKMTGKSQAEALACAAVFAAEMGLAEQARTLAAAAKAADPSLEIVATTPTALFTATR